MSLSILVIVHEFGHYIVARIFKIRVEKFYLFFDAGFALLRYKPKNSHTEYGIGAWYNERDKEFYKNQEMYDATPVRMIKAEFRKYGYKIYI